MTMFVYDDTDQPIDVLQIPEGHTFAQIAGARVNHLVCPRGLTGLLVIGGQVPRVTLNADIEGVTIDGCYLKHVDADGVLHKVEAFEVTNNPGLTTIDTLQWVPDVLVVLMDLRGNKLERVEKPLPWLDVLNISNNSPALTVRDLRFMFPNENVYYPARGDYVATLCGRGPDVVMRTSDERMRELYLAVYERGETGLDLNHYFESLDGALEPEAIHTSATFVP